MTAEKLNAIKARLAKPTPEPFKTMLEELVEAVEAKHEGNKPAKAKGNHAPATVPVIDTPENTDA